MFYATRIGQYNDTVMTLHSSDLLRTLVELARRGERMTTPGVITWTSFLPVGGSIVLTGSIRA
jgi:hypothetical protein